ncbi:MAG TPA: BadF/BadG/BcrA/BcrD ATPase family protein [Pyrinomonadaceae bacterium]|nr:BadF/BadG/BcrA/BcrD ATPase family protein [Pyrinomonadaceae bacterium]
MLTVADMTGRVLAAEKFQNRLNYHESTKTALGAELYYLVKHILDTCGISVTDFCVNEGKICAGITGVTTKYDRLIGMRDVWQASSLNKAEVMSTGGIEIEFTGATRLLCGAALSCHAGSVAMARTEQAIRRVGGWGPLIGDEGSGYWIGSQVINTLCRIRDGRLSSTSKTKLPQYVREELQNCPTWQEISKQYATLRNCNWVDAFVLLAQRTRDTKEYRYIVSDLAKAAFRIFDEHPEDEFTREIISCAADKLVEQVESAVARADLHAERIPLVLWGGIFRYNRSFCDLVREKIGQKLPLTTIITPIDSGTMRPAIGALLFALSGSVFSLPSPEIMTRVEQSASQFPALAND